MTIAVDPTIQQKPLGFTPKIFVQIGRKALTWFDLQRRLLRPSNTSMTAFCPNIAVGDCHAKDPKTLELLRERAFNKLMRNCENGHRNC
jgi:hypothetical protein